MLGIPGRSTTGSFEASEWALLLALHWPTTTHHLPLLTTLHHNHLPHHLRPLPPAIILSLLLILTASLPFTTASLPFPTSHCPLQSSHRPSFTLPFLGPTSASTPVELAWSIELPSWPPTTPGQCHPFLHLLQLNSTTLPSKKVFSNQDITILHSPQSHYFVNTSHSSIHLSTGQSPFLTSSLHMPAALCV